MPPPLVSVSVWEPKARFAPDERLVVFTVTVFATTLPESASTRLPAVLVDEVL